MNSPDSLGALAVSSRSLHTWSHMQGYGAVNPVAGLTALCSAIAGLRIPPNVVMNPFDWERFLSGVALTQRPPTLRSRQLIVNIQKPCGFPRPSTSPSLQHAWCAGERSVQPFFEAVRPAKHVQHNNAIAAAAVSQHRPEVSLEDLISTITGASIMHLISVTGRFQAGLAERQINASADPGSRLRNHGSKLGPAIKPVRKSAA